MISLIAGVLFQHVDNDIVYSTVGKKELTLDAYRPREANGRVFIAVHGGGFKTGSKGGNTAELCRYLSSRGFTCFDINYRLQSDTGGSIQDATNAAVTDVVSAFNWTIKNAKTYGGNPDKIAIGGSSAGAIASLYATYSRRLPAKAVVDLWGGMYSKETDIRKNDAPLLIVHGKSDKIVPYTQATILNNRAKKVGINVRFLSTNGGHSLDLNTSIGGYTIFEHVDSFLRETIK